MIELRLMWNCPENSRKESGSIRFPESILLPIIVLFLSCAGSAVRLNPPKTNLENPFAFLSMRPNEAFLKGYRSYQKGEQFKARSEFQKILKKAPSHYPADLAIGYTFLAEGNYDAAERHIGKALNTASSYPQAHFAMSQIHEARQDYDSALAALDEVAKLNPDYPGIQQNRDIMKLKATEKHLGQGRALDASDPEEAIAHFQVAQQLAPEISEIPLEIAEVYLKQNACKEAVPYLEQADTAMPDHVEVKTLLFNCYADLEEYNKALTLYEDLTLLKPANPEMQKRVQAIKRTLALHALPEEYQIIPTTEQITRSQLAAYLVLNLGFLKKYSSEGPSSIIVDTLDHWAKAAIQKVVDLGVMDLFPNRTFQAPRPITKLELARAASRILEILEASKALTVPPAFVSIPDLPAGNLYYPMVSRALAAGVISLDNDGKFNPYRPVTGAELISMVNRFQALMERS